MLYFWLAFSLTLFASIGNFWHLRKWLDLCEARYHLTRSAVGQSERTLSQVWRRSESDPRAFGLKKTQKILIMKKMGFEHNSPQNVGSGREMRPRARPTNVQRPEKTRLEIFLLDPTISGVCSDALLLFSRVSISEPGSATPWMCVSSGARRDFAFLGFVCFIAFSPLGFCRHLVVVVVVVALELLSWLLRHRHRRRRRRHQSSHTPTSTPRPRVMSSYQRRDYPSGQFKPPGQATPIAIPRNPPPAQSQNYGDRIRPEYDRQTDRRSYGGNNSNSHSNSQSRDSGYNKGGRGGQQGQGGSGGQPRARIVNPGYEDFDQGDENLRLAKGKRETDEEVRGKALATLPTKAEVDENERIAADNRAEAKKVADERKVKNAARLLREKEQQKRDDEEKRRVAVARKATPSSAAFPKAHPGVNKIALLDPNKTSTATFYGPSASGPKLPTAKRKPDAPNRDKAADAAVQRKNNSKSTGAEAGTSKGKKKPATVTIDLGSDDECVFSVFFGCTRL